MTMEGERKRFTKSEINTFDGIINLLDAIQDEEELRKKYGAISCKITRKKPSNEN